MFRWRVRTVLPFVSTGGVMIGNMSQTHRRKGEEKGSRQTGAEAGGHRETLAYNKSVKQMRLQGYGGQRWMECARLGLDAWMKMSATGAPTCVVYLRCLRRIRVLRGSSSASLLTHEAQELEYCSLVGGDGPYCGLAQP